MQTSSGSVIIDITTIRLLLESCVLPLTFPESLQLRWRQ